MRSFLYNFSKYLLENPSRYIHICPYLYCIYVYLYLCILGELKLARVLRVLNALQQGGFISGIKYSLTNGWAYIWGEGLKPGGLKSGILRYLKTNTSPQHHHLAADYSSACIQDSGQTFWWLPCFLPRCEF